MTLAVADLAESDARAQRPLRSVVGRRDRPIGDEDEEMGADFLDHALQFDASRMRRREAHDVVEAGLQARGVGFQRRIGEPVASTDPAGAAQEMAQSGREAALALVDGVLLACAVA